MAFPLGANAAIYNMLRARHPNTPVTIFEYNEAVRWINAAQPGSVNGQDVPLFTEAPAYTPPTTPTTPGGGTVVTGPGGAPTSEAYNADVLGHEYDIKLQEMADAAAMARTQASVSASLAAAQASAQAQLEAQREADRASLERLRYQLGDSLAAALMANDQNMFQRTLDTAELAADQIGRAHV